MLPRERTVSARPAPAGSRPPVTLWIFNHEFRYISEQIEFFCASLSQHGYRARASRRPNPATLNVVIENFSPSTAKAVEVFCRAHGKRVAVIQTEHLDFLQGRVLFHGVELASRDDYIPPDTKIQRLTSLLTMREHVHTFFRLGDLPRLRNFEQVLPRIAIRSIPFPVIRASDRAPQAGPGARAQQFDFVFTGILTAHRRRVVRDLFGQFKVHIGGGAVSRRRRDALNATSGLVLNVPQNEGWAWISTMRVLAALRCGRLTVAIGNFEQCAINAFCLILTEREAEPHRLRDLIDRRDELYRERLAAYDRFVASEANAPFPHGEFELWAALEL